MNDFLTALAARTLGTVPVVTPRRPSPFESTDGVALPEQADQWEAPPPPRSMRGSEHPPAAATSPLRAVEPAAPEDPGLRSRLPDAERTTEPRRAEPAKVMSVAPASTEQSLPAPPEAETSARRPEGPDRPAGRNRVIPPEISRRAPEAPRPVEREAPAIHVTIGRVEVRAVHRVESAPAGRKSPEAPRLSLGAYLRGGRG